MNKNKILIIEDEPAIRLGMQHFLSSLDYEVFTANDGLTGMELISHKPFDLIISDVRLPGMDGITILQKTKEISPTTGVIIITAYADVKTAVDTMKQGAFDYISKPFSNEELKITVERFFQFRNLKEEVSVLRESLREKHIFDEFIGNSVKMKEVFDKISAIAPTDVAVLIQGESGTGKELVANAIQSLSLRKDKPFVKINCAAIPETLFEDELFGHEKGAFTSANEIRKGKIETAHKGTIFFDEIGDMPLQMQAKLLRVIEDKTVTRLGGNVTIKVDVRFLYATSKNLLEAVRNGSLREDLFYRINIVPIYLPPLRERREDIIILAEYFLRHFEQKYGKSKMTFSSDSYQYLIQRNYKGNVRELKHIIERAVLLCKTKVIDKKDLLDDVYQEIINKEPLQPTITLNQKLMETEKEFIRQVLKSTDGKKQEAAQKLGISRKALWQKLKEYGL